VRQVQYDPLPGAASVGLRGFGLVVGLLGALAATHGLGRTGWLVGLTCAAVANTLVVAALVAHSRARLGPADRVTLTRAALACGAAALVTESVTRPGPSSMLAWLAAVALVLDGVDGRVARRTGTVTALGARFDMEVDAFLILVLSVHAAADIGAWVLSIGLASYVLLVARHLVPWLRRSAPPRYWCKVVAVIQGVVLTAVAAGLLPHGLSVFVVLVALALLVESFGREVLWLWRTRRDQPRVPQPTLSRASCEPSDIRPVG
jgi:phosphatidylglycerophosphate synthase